MDLNAMNAKQIAQIEMKHENTKRAVQEFQPDYNLRTWEPGPNAGEEQITPTGMSKAVRRTLWVTSLIVALGVTVMVGIKSIIAQ